MAPPTKPVAPFFHLVTDLGWGAPELQSLGMSRHLAKRVVAEAPPLSIPPRGREVPVAGTASFNALLQSVGLAPPAFEVTSVVPIDATSRFTLPLGLYIRARARGKLVRPAASYLATGTNTVLDQEYPIVGHAIAPDGHTSLRFTTPATQQAYSAARSAIGTAYLEQMWPAGPVDVWVVSAPTPIHIAIGNAPIQGTRSYERQTMLAAAQLDGTPTV